MVWAVTYLPVSMSVWNRLCPPSGLNMFILRSLFISISLFGVKLCCPFLGGVTSKDMPVLCTQEGTAVITLQAMKLELPTQHHAMNRQSQQLAESMLTSAMVKHDVATPCRQTLLHLATYLHTTIDILEDFNLLVSDQVAPVPSAKPDTMNLFANLSCWPVPPYFFLHRLILQSKCSFYCAWDVRY